MLHWDFALNCSAVPLNSMDTFEKKAVPSVKLKKLKFYINYICHGMCIMPSDYYVKPLVGGQGAIIY